MIARSCQSFLAAKSRRPHGCMHQEVPWSSSSPMRILAIERRCIQDMKYKRGRPLLRYILVYYSNSYPSSYYCIQYKRVGSQTDGPASSSSSFDLFIFERTKRAERGAKSFDGRLALSWRVSRLLRNQKEGVHKERSSGGLKSRSHVPYFENTLV